MPVDTRQKRMSALFLDGPWRGPLVDATEAGFTQGWAGWKKMDWVVDKFLERAREYYKENFDPDELRTLAQQTFEAKKNGGNGGNVKPLVEKKRPKTGLDIPIGGTIGEILPEQKPGQWNTTRGLNG